jgi:hypothetical protein
MDFLPGFFPTRRAMISTLAVYESYIKRKAIAACGVRRSLSRREPLSPLGSRRQVGAAGSAPTRRCPLATCDRPTRHQDHGEDLSPLCRNGVRRSIGAGKTIVVDCDPPSSSSVCR